MIRFRSRRAPVRSSRVRFAIAFAAFVASFAFVSIASARDTSAKRKVWVVLKDKPRGADAFRNAIVRLTPESLRRRQKVGVDVSDADLPLDTAYVHALVSAGARVLAESRWMNAVSCEIEPNTLPTISGLPFVSEILPVLHGSVQSSHNSSSATLVTSAAASSSVFLSGGNVLPASALNLTGPYHDTVTKHYGGSALQLERMNVRPLHELGIDATGVIIGFTDTGCRWRALEADRTRKVLGEYDFVFNDSLVANESNDDPGADGHGTGTFGAAMGFMPDSQIGPAYNAFAYLAKTEDVRSESPVEEDNYVRALEWFESKGVDVVSTSLGYFTFDSGFTSYTYPDANGHTAISTRAALEAARHGMLVVAAMGNNGNTSMPYLTAPADADSIISVGALELNDSIALFSARGPTSDGRIKPEIVAPGVNVWAPGFDSFFGGTGTSYATPLVSASCALIMQAHPEASAQAVRSAIMSTGDKAATPDTAYGWGKINVYGAALRLGTIIGPHRLLVDSVVHLVVGVAANNGIRRAQVRYRIGDALPLNRETDLVETSDSNIYIASFPSLPQGTTVRYIIAAADGADTLTYSPRLPDSTYSFTIGKGSLAVASPQERLDGIEYVGPNPAQRFVNVRVSSALGATLTLFDVAGRERLHVHLASGLREAKLDVSNLPVGTYWLHYQSARIDGVTSARDIQSMRAITLIR